MPRAMRPRPCCRGRRERRKAQSKTANCRRSGSQLDITMPRFKNDEVEIAYLDEGEGDPIVLVHGFASTKEVNWVLPGWVTTLTRAGRRVIALDNRGHGASSKLYDPSAYHSATMAEDVRALLDHLEIARADVMGYSMGARIGAYLALDDPGRVRSRILGGLGDHLVNGVGLPIGIAQAMEAPSLEAISDPIRRMFRNFADRNHSDRVRARRLHSGIAPDDERRGGRPDCLPDACRDRNQG